MTTPTRMRRVEVGLNDPHVVSADVPTPAPGEVLVRALVSGVCGSDTHAAHGRHPFIALPYLPGHEVVGEVAGLGTDVDGVAVGDRVTVEPDLPCWHCKMCTTGRENLCENLRFFGCGYPQGGMADFFTIAANRLHRVPDGLSLTQAALIEPLATPVHAAGLAGDLQGKAVVIIGVGTIGILLTAVVLARGAAKVVTVDMRDEALDRARKLGAATVSAAGTVPEIVDRVRAQLGESADVVFDCVAIQPTFDQAIALANKGGTVVVVGVPTGAVQVPLHIVQDSQIRIQGSATYLPADFHTAAKLLADGVVDAEEVVTSIFPIDQVATAFATSGAVGQLKVLVEINGTLIDSR